MASETRPLAPDRPVASRSAQARVDADGVRTVTTTSGRRAVWLVALAIAVPITATVVAVALIRYAPAKTATAPPTRIAGAAATDPVRAGAPQPTAAPRAEKLIPRRITGVEQVVPESGQPGATVKRERKSKPDLGAAEAITALREEGETGGIAAFPLPGTKPIKSGIIVPEEYELPEGYVRHYQTSDDGKQLPAILMFHPDYQFVNERGEPVAVPADHIVPPEMAPQGMPIEMLPPQAASDSKP